MLPSARNMLIHQTNMKKKTHSSKHITFNDSVQYFGCMLLFLFRSIISYIERMEKKFHTFEPDRGVHFLYIVNLWFRSIWIEANFWIFISYNAGNTHTQCHFDYIHCKSITFLQYKNMHYSVIKKRVFYVPWILDLLKLLFFDITIKASNA